MTISEYIDAVSVAVTYARPFYCPPERDERRERLMMLARDFGYGLSVYSDEEIRRVVTSTYGRIVVRSTFDSVGVPLDNREWLREIWRGIDRGRKDEKVDNKEGDDA